jgi:predicted DNA-binding transcriptional regulator YafY
MDTPARLLRLLAMFTTRPSWNADDLAARLEVTTRTLRRDVTRLRELGYPITSTTGRYGGYELGAGGHLPPLLLDDDEAIAVSVALRELSAEADPTLGEAALSASTKLRQVLPAPLRDRVDALGEVVVGVRKTRRPRATDGRERVELPSLMILATTCRRGERVRFTYRDGGDRVSERRVEPHRLVSLGRRWYLVGYDLDRADWRTYRVDRVSTLSPTGHRNTPRATPDAAALVSEGVAVRVFDTRARVRVMAPAHVAAHHIGPTIGVIEPGDDTSCVVTIGGDADWIARYLISLEVEFEVLEPATVNDELRALATGIIARLDRDQAAAGVATTNDSKAAAATSR